MADPAVDLRAGEHYELLPFRFRRLSGDRVVVTNLVGEHLLISANELDQLIDHKVSGEVSRRLMGKHVIRRPGDQLPVELLAAKSRTRSWRLMAGPALHLFVVTLRCEHSCRYCQVSRKNSEANMSKFDMTPETAVSALDIAFGSPSPAMKIEFQGGEPLLNLDLIEFIAAEATERNKVAEKNLCFIITSNLALLDDRAIEVARRFDMSFSTSLDGPQSIHDQNRPRPGGDSWERTLSGIERVQRELGRDRVAALMTTTDLTLDSVEAVIDTYVAAGLNEIFLRPISPYGFAARSGRRWSYDVDRWLDFYRAGLDHIVRLNDRGTVLREGFAGIVLMKMLTNDDPGYVDLRSPAGAGIGALVYNYEGGVYASDESRMLAEMGDETFRLGNVADSNFSQIMHSDVLLDSLEDSFALSSPMCTDCAYEPFCGSDPVYHHATQGDVVGHKAFSAFCRRNMGVFDHILDRYENDPVARRVFQGWIAR